MAVVVAMVGREGSMGMVGKVGCISCTAWCICSGEWLTNDGVCQRQRGSAIA